LLYILLFVST